MDLDLFFVPNYDNFYWPNNRQTKRNRQLLDSLLMPSLSTLEVDIPRHVKRNVTSDMKSDDKKFQVNLDCSHFTPEEIDVKTVDREVIIHGKHEEKMDKHGWVSREFTRRYTLPEECESEDVTSSLNSDGMLTIKAPKRVAQPLKDNERVVPIKVMRLSGDEHKKQIEN